MPLGPIYLDYNATTPIDPQVREAMLPYFGAEFGNPSSGHSYGKSAQSAVAHARKQLADLIGAQPDEIVFTGSGSEASNLAIKGTFFAASTGTFRRWIREHQIIISSIEHPATAAPCRFLGKLGCKTTEVDVDRFGQVDPESVRRAIGRRTRLVSIMHSNNEVGTINPIAEIAKIAHERSVPVHTDVAQSLGKVPIDVNQLGVDLMTIAGHKLYAPKGIGALFVRRGTRLTSLVHGADHESGRRAGTENVPYIVGLGMAAELARKSLPQAADRLRTLRDRLHGRLRDALGSRIELNGHPEQRLPNTLNLSFVGHIGSELLEKLPGVAASTGSACHEGKVSQSPVLCAMKVPPETGQGALRLTVGRYSTEDEIDRAAELLISAARS